MAELTAGFETGVDGNTVAITDAGDASAFDFVTLTGGGTAIYDDTHVKDGTLAVKSVAGTSETAFGWTTSFGTQTEHYGRLYAWIDSAVDPSSNAFAQFRNGATRGARIDFQFTGGNVRIRLIDAPASGDLTGSVNVARDQWIRVEWHVIHSATVGQIEAKLFNDSDSITPSETISSPATWDTLASVDGAQFGARIAGVSGFIVWLDAIVANAATYPGPVAVPSRVRTPKRLVGPTLVTNSPVTGYTVPATYITRMRHVHISNPSGSPVDMTLSIGTDAAGTRLLDGRPIAADSVYEMACDEVLAAGEIVQISASSTNVLTITISGEEWVPT